MLRLNRVFGQRLHRVVKSEGATRSCSVAALGSTTVASGEVASSGAPLMSRTVAVLCGTVMSDEAAAAGAPTSSVVSRKLDALEERHVAHNYRLLGPQLVRGEGVHVWSVDGDRFLDLHAGFAAVNQGHCHPRIVAALSRQAGTLGLTSRGLRSAALPAFAQRLTQAFGYDAMLPSSTGVETGETAIKLARRWGYEVKGVPDNEARVVVLQGNFWGRSLAAISASTTPSAYSRFGPFLPGFDAVPIDDLAALEAALADPRTCAFMAEPIQGEAGIVVPSADYLPAAAALCRKHGALLIADEVQTGMGRAGALSFAAARGVRPDILCLGKALGGGLYPVSAVLADERVMSLIRPGEHGSTWGGNAVAAAVGTASLDVLLDERLCERAQEVGALLRATLRRVADKFGGRLITGVRGEGLLIGVEVAMAPEEAPALSAWALSERLASHGGVIARPATERVVRIAPPLTLSAAQAEEAAAAIEASLAHFAS